MKFSPLPKFPAVRRDMALVIDAKISFQKLNNLLIKFQVTC
jgi:phenylalanyl-tRNA synthetase beta subunit